MAFEKIIFLPSGGLLYSPFVRVRPLTNDFLLFQNDNDLFGSIFEYQLAIIRRCCDLDFDILKITTQDFFYLWVYIFMTDIQQEDGMYLSYKCSDCNHDNKIYFQASKFSVNVINPYEQTISQNTTYVSSDNRLFARFRLRTAADNILFGNLLLNSEHELNDWYCWLLYIVIQLEELRIDGQLIERHDYIGALTYNIHFTELIDIFYKLRDHDNQFGLDNRVNFLCQKCNKPQKTVFYDNMLSSLIREEETSPKAAMLQRSILE